MNTTLFKQAMLAIVLPLILMGCSIHIPISTSMKTQAPPPKKTQKTIFVVMSKEQEKKITLYKRSALANQLKKRCGSGGTVKDGTIEIQVDHRDALVLELTKQGCTVKKAGE